MATSPTTPKVMVLRKPGETTTTKASDMKIVKDTIDTKGAKDRKDQQNSGDGVVVKAPRKLPEVPRPKVSLSAPQNSKALKDGEEKAVSSLGSSRPKLSPAAPAPSSSHWPLRQKSTSPTATPATSSSESSRNRGISGSTSSVAQSSTAYSSDSSSRASVPRALPIPGIARRAMQEDTSSSARSSVSPVRVGAVKRGPVGGAGKGKEKGEIVGGEGKKKISVDKGSLWSDSSEAGAGGSESDGGRGVGGRGDKKKKIPVDASVARPLPAPRMADGNAAGTNGAARGGGGAYKPSVVSDIEDIPFADESEMSEVDERFHTPATSLKVN